MYLLCIFLKIAAASIFTNYCQSSCVLSISLYSFTSSSSCRIPRWVYYNWYLFHVMVPNNFQNVSEFKGSILFFQIIYLRRNDIYEISYFIRALFIHLFIFELGIFECLLGEYKIWERTRVTILVFEIIFPIQPQYMALIYPGLVQKIYIEDDDRYLGLELIYSIGLIFF